eukprot:scaffold7040_cov31-Tisochrysis_lutea.AAC.2
MAQGKLDEFTDIGQLLAHATDIVVANVVLGLLIIALDWLALTVDDGIRSDNAILGRIRLYNLEFDSTHTSTNKEQVILAHGAVRLEEVRLEEDVEQIA